MTSDDVTMNVSLQYTYRVTDPERFVLDVAGDRVAIAGATPRATLYGACAFLERFLGIRWYWPGEVCSSFSASVRLALSATGRRHR